MKVEDILKKQRAKGAELSRFKASTLSIEEYTRDKNSPRPYHMDHSFNEDKVKNDKIKTKFTSSTKINESRKVPRVKKTASLLNAPITFKAGRKLKSIFNYEDLVGNSKLIVDEVVRRCLITRSLCTGFIEKEELSQILGICIGSIKTTCVRLRAKKVIERFETTKGRKSKWKFFLAKRILEQASKIPES